MTLVSSLVQVTFPSAEIPMTVVAPGPTIRKKRASTARANGIVHSRTATATNENRNERHTDLDNPKPRADNFFLAVSGNFAALRARRGQDGAGSERGPVFLFFSAGPVIRHLGVDNLVIGSRLTAPPEVRQARKRATSLALGRSVIVPSDTATDVTES